MTSFDDIVLAYDNTIDWKARLDRELPFILSLLEDKTNPRILDMACGSGHHTIALADHGFEVIGFDSSELMIRTAQSHALERQIDARFLHLDMENFRETINGPFDLVICLGNSLALLNTIDILREVVTDVFKVMNEGASFVGQILNFEEIHWTGFRTFPTKKAVLSNGEEITFARLFEHTDYPFSSTLVMSAFREIDGVWKSEVTTQKVLNLNYESISTILRNIGFPIIKVYSDYNESPLDRKNHRNMIIQAVK